MYKKCSTYKKAGITFLNVDSVNKKYELYTMSGKKLYC